jgi:PAS domain S-box-containing protein
MDRQQEILRAIALTGQYLSDVRNLSERLPAVLAQLGQAVQVVQVYIYENSQLPDGRYLASQRFTWSVFRQMVRRDIPRLQNLDYVALGFQRWIEYLQAGRPIYGPVETFPESEQRSWGKRSAVIVPVRYGGHWWGFLGFDDLTGQRVWTPGEVETLTYVGQTVGAAFENAYLLQIEAKRRREAEILNQVSSYLTQSFEQEETLARAMETVLDYLGGELFITLTLLEASGEALVVMAQNTTYQNPLENLGERIPLAETNVSQRVVEGKRPFHLATITPEQITTQRTHHAYQAGLRSLLYLPLLLQDRTIGVLHIDVLNTPRQFSDAEITFCQSFANLIATAIERQRLQDTERAQLRLARTLQQVGALLTTQLTLDEVYERIFDLLAQVIPYDSVSIQLLGDKKEHLFMVAGRGFPDELDVKNFIHAITQHCLNKFPPGGSVTVSPDTYADPRWIRDGSVDYIRSWIGVLLRVKGETIGILNVDSRQVNAFNEQTAETAAAFANQAAIAIENARLYKNAQLRARELAILNEVALTTAAVVDIDDLLQKTTETFVSLFDQESFGFVLLDEAAGIALPHDSYHGLSALLRRKPIPLNRSIIGVVAQTGEAIVLPDIHQDGRCWLGDDRLRSTVLVPLKVENQVISVIAAGSTELDHFSADDARFFTTLASFVSLAIARTRLYGQLRQRSTNLAEEVQARTAELQAERDRTITILESAGESIVVTDTEAKILYVNQATERQSGYSQKDLWGQNINLLESGLTPTATYEAMWQALRGGQRWSGELVNRRKDGSLYDVSSTISPIFNNQREIINFVSIQADITRLKEVDRLKTKFVSNVSHELRTPLTNIKIYVTLLERGLEENRQRYLRIVRHETDRLTQLIQDLLDLSRLDTEPYPDLSAATDLRQSILDYLDVFAGRAEVRQMTFGVEVPVDLPWVGVEERHVGQLLTNLLGNALTYTPPGGHIWVRAGAVDGADTPQVWLEVADSGIGISPQDMAHLFNRFYRGDTAERSGAPGTGLGLAICFEIVKRYHGHIDVVSEVGVGSTFSVRLPAARSTQAQERLRD